MKKMLPTLSLDQLETELLNEQPRRWRMDSMALPTYVSAIALVDIARSLREIARKV